MPKTLNISLSTQSIDAAITQLREYSAWVERKTREINSYLAMLALKTAEQRFGSAMYDGDNDVSLRAEPISNGWAIIAEGQAVCFIEFGAGVYYNGKEPYPEPRPSGVVGIGEYGQGNGKRNRWVFYAHDGTKVFTHGNPAAMPMFYAKEEVLAEFAAIARRVFG